MLEHIVIIGAGGVGGYFGGRLANHLRSQGSSVKMTFVARGEHLSAILESGLTLKSPDGSSVLCVSDHVTDDLSAVDPADFVLVATKSYDLEGVLDDVARIAGEGAFVTGPLNGLDIYDRIKLRAPRAVVLPSCAYISTAISAPGEVTHFGGPGRLVMGPDPQCPDERPDAVLGAMTDAGITAEWSTDVVKEIWGKYLFIAPLCLLTANNDLTVGEVLESGPVSADLVAMIEELRAISEKMGIGLPADIVEICLQKSRAFPHGTKTSFQRDVEAGKPDNELDLFGDTIIQLASKYGVPAPTAARIVSELHV